MVGIGLIRVLITYCAEWCRHLLPSRDQQSVPISPLTIAAIEVQDGAEDLVIAASRALARAWEDGREKYPEGVWRQKGAFDHTLHFVGHARAIRDIILGIEWEENLQEPHEALEDIDHAIFRLAALRWLITQGLK